MTTAGDRDEGTPWITLREAAELLRCSKSTVHRMRRHNQIGYRAEGWRAMRYSRADVLAMAREIERQLDDGPTDRGDRGSAG
ncbi:unnamed protein product [uncultured bacterium]|nr:unnamed protein product [uncultured bacterium]